MRSLIEECILGAQDHQEMSGHTLRAYSEDGFRVKIRCNQCEVRWGFTLLESLDMRACSLEVLSVVLPSWYKDLDRPKNRFERMLLESRLSGYSFRESFRHQVRKNHRVMFGFGDPHCIFKCLDCSFGIPVHIEDPEALKIVSRFVEPTPLEQVIPLIPTLRETPWWTKYQERVV